ncbi:MAG: hypothetical protein WAW36_19070 [Methylovulum miyakonense]|uniref:hypothetical protein n=1 Tax=Methylovulum miyakonense TaxID=645578 RepID=UPI003BB5C8F2
MHTQQQAIDYIKNNNGVVRKKQFISDFDPIGEKLLAELVADGIVETNTTRDGKLTIIFFADDGWGEQK